MGQRRRETLAAATVSEVNLLRKDECIVNFECEMTHAVEVGTHTIFVGKIVNACEHENAKSMRKLYTLGGLGGRNYGAWPLPARNEAAPEKPKEKPAQASGQKSE